MEPSERWLTTYDVLQKHGVDRRSFLRFCTQSAAAIGLSAALVPKLVAAMETKPRIPVLWLHGSGVHLLQRIFHSLFPPHGSGCSP